MDWRPLNAHRPRSFHGEHRLAYILVERGERHVRLKETEATIHSIILLHSVLNPLKFKIFIMKIKLVKVDNIRKCQIPKVGPASCVGPKLLNYLY